LSLQFTAVENDQFAARHVLQSAAPMLSGDLRTATVEAGEPLHQGRPTTRSLWSEWTVPRTGRWCVHAEGMRWGGLLVGLYRGESLETLVPVESLASADRKMLYFHAKGGEKLKIALAYSGTPEFPFNGFISEVPVPANDNFDEAELLRGPGWGWFVSNFGATSEPGEPTLSSEGDLFPAASVWYQWIAPVSGSIEVTLSDVGIGTWWGPPRVTFFTGASIRNLAIAAENYVGPNLARTFVLNVVAGETYQIQVVSPLAYAGDFTLVLTPKSRPANDDFTQRSPLTGTQVFLGFQLADATLEAGEPNGTAALFAKTLWWKWTAPATGWTTVDTSGSSLDTRLAVFTGSTLGSLNLVAMNDDEFSPAELVSFGTSRLGFQAQQGTEYQIQVSGWSGGLGQLALIGQQLPVPEISTFEIVVTYPTLTLRGAPGQTIWIQSSPNLVDWTWREMIRFDSSQRVWFDQFAYGSPILFYRIVLAAP
jgi:hypothetical protein